MASKRALVGPHTISSASATRTRRVQLQQVPAVAADGVRPRVVFVDTDILVL
jgi:hypothetical protein